MNAIIRKIRRRIRDFADESAFAVVSTLLMAVGIGVCAVIFSVANAVLLRQLPYPNAERLVEVKQFSANGRRINLCDVHFDPKVESAYE